MTTVSAPTISEPTNKVTRTFDGSMRNACRDEHLKLLLEHRAGLGDATEGGVGNRVTLGIVPEGTPGVPTHTAWWYFDKERKEARVCVGEGIVHGLKYNHNYAEHYAKSFVRHEMGHDRWTSRNLKKCKEAADSAGIPFSVVNLWEDARIEHLARKEGWGNFDWSNFEKIPEITPKCPHSLIAGKVWLEGDKQEVNEFAMLALQGGCSEEQSEFASDYYKRAVRVKKTEALIPLIVEFQKEWETKWPAPPLQPGSAGRENSDQNQEPTSSKPETNATETQPNRADEKSSDASKQAKPGQGAKNSESAKNGNNTDQPANENGSKSVEAGQGESVPNNQNAHQQPRSQNQEQRQGKNQAQEESAKQENKPGENTDKSEGSKTPEQPKNGIDWSVTPRSEDMEAALSLNSDPEARQKLGERLSFLFKNDKERQKGCVIEHSNTNMMNHLMIKENPNLFAPLDEMIVQEMTGNLRSAFKGTMRNSLREAPTRHIDCRAVMQDREEVWRSKVPFGFQGKRKVVVYLDCSGSMNTCSKEKEVAYVIDGKKAIRKLEDPATRAHLAGKELIAALGNLQREGKIEGYLVAHNIIPKNRKMTLAYQTFPVTTSHEDLRAIMANGAGEGILPALQSTIKLAKDADVVLFISDGDIDDASSKEDYAKLGIRPIGFYVGNPGCASKLPKHVDRVIVSSSKKEATMALAQIIAQTPARRR